MQLCHFAFGQLHRDGKHAEQAQAFLESILLPKKLRSSGCPEFMPVLTAHKGLWADPNSACVDIPFNKLRHWSPAEHYGKLGVGSN